MELRHLNTFLVVAETGGFTRAGESLGYAQSTVTAHIRALEMEAGHPLFDRLGKTVRLTEAGERLLPFARKMVQLSRSALEAVDVGDEPTGNLIIGAPESLTVYRLPSILHTFTQQYPRVRLTLQPGQCWEMRSLVKNGEIALSFLMDGGKPDPDLICIPLKQEPLCLVASPHHPLVGKKEVTPEDLKAETLLKTEPGCSYRDLFERRLREGGVKSHSSIDFWNVEAIKKCVMCGLGVAYLPEMTVVKELDAGEMVKLPWVHDHDRVLTQLAYHKDKWVTPAMDRLIEVIRERAAGW